MKFLPIHSILLLIVFNSISLHLFSQEDKVKRPNAVFFAPLNFLDPINPSFQFGYERILNQKWVVQLEGGYIINKGLLTQWIDRENDIPDFEYSNKGFKARTELKRIVYKRSMIRLYVSGELYYLKNKSKVQNQFSVADTTFNYPNTRPVGTDAYTDYFVNDKEKYGFNIKFGLKLWLGKHFLVEPHGGIGVAYRINKHHERENILDPSLYDDFTNDNVLGEKWIVNIPLNVKLGYRF